MFFFFFFLSDGQNVHTEGVGKESRKKAKKLQDPKGHRVTWGRQDKFLCCYCLLLTLVMLCHSLVENIFK